eukprot:UC4_evm6s1188
MRLLDPCGSVGSLHFLNALYLIVSIVLIAVAAGSQSFDHFHSEFLLPIVGGIIACGVLLMITAILGLAGAENRNQGAIFAYMLFLEILMRRSNHYNMGSMLLIIFLIQFSVSLACLTCSKETMDVLLKRAWCKLDWEDKSQIQLSNKCFGYKESDYESYLAWEADENGKPPQCLGISDTSCSISYPLKSTDTVWGMLPGCHCNCQLLNDKLRSWSVCSESTFQQTPCQDCYSVMIKVMRSVFNKVGTVGLVFSFFQLLGIACAYKLRTHIKKNPEMAAKKTNYAKFGGKRKTQIPKYDEDSDDEDFLSYKEQNEVEGGDLAFVDSMEHRSGRTTAEDNPSNPF